MMLTEMVMLVLIARRLYKRELPKTEENMNNNNIVISTHVSTIENIMKGTIQCMPASPLKGKYKSNIAY